MKSFLWTECACTTGQDNSVVQYTWLSFMKAFSSLFIWSVVSFCDVGWLSLRFLRSLLLFAAIMNIVLSQPCGKIFVGDPHQQIYTFRGAVNALFTVPHTHVFYLTQVRALFAPEAHKQALWFTVLVFQWLLCARTCARFCVRFTVCSHSLLLSSGSLWFSGYLQSPMIFIIVICFFHYVNIWTDDAEQWWVKLLVPSHGPRCWHRTVLAVIVFFT